MSHLEPEIIFSLFGLKVSNTLFTTFFVDAILIFIIFVINKNLSLYPKKFQTIVESIIDYFYSLTEQVSETKVKSIFPWVMSFFIFIFFSNLTGLIPGLATFGLVEHEKIIPFIRPPTSDFNTTFALALISLVATHALSIRYLGILDYLKRFFSLNPIFLFVGILELVGELTKLLSLSFRLFGNIYAGEVVLATISSIFAYIAPIPFLMLESIVALVQALVFSMLTMAFMSILTTAHESEH